MWVSIRRILSALTLILLFLATTSAAGVATYSPTGDPTLLLWLVPWGP
jgi:hypothetical protein